MIAVDELKDFTEHAVRCLCDKPNEVAVSTDQSSGTVVILFVECAKSDLSLVIGGGGKNVNSLRHILSSIAAKHRVRAMLVLKE